MIVSKHTDSLVLKIITVFMLTSLHSHNAVCDSSAQRDNIFDAVLSRIAQKVYFQDSTIPCNVASNPLWIKINKEIEEFKQQHGLPKLSHIILKLSNYQIQKCQYIKDITSEVENKQDLLKIEKIKFLIQKELKNHNISEKIEIIFTKDEMYTKECLMCVSAHRIIFNPKCFSLDDKTLKYIIEHEIAHIIMHDHAHRKYYNLILKDNPVAQQELKLLTEKRADTYSALQSLSNAESLYNFYQKGGGYARELHQFYIEKFGTRPDLTREQWNDAVKKIKRQRLYDAELFEHMLQQEKIKKQHSATTQIPHNRAK